MNAKNSLTAFPTKICDLIQRVIILFKTDNGEQFMSKSDGFRSATKRFGQVLISGLLCLAIAVLLSVSVNAQRTKPSANFDKLWVDYDVTEGGQKGMRIHLKFTVRGMKGLDSAIRIYFQTGDGKNLTDKNNSFVSSAGYVALYKNLKIDYDPGYYEDLAVFMPYKELDLGGGEYDLKMDVDLIYRVSGELIQHLTLYDFVFTQPEDDSEDMAPLPDSVDDSNEKASVEKVWYDYDVVEGGKKGMRIHVKFKVSGLKGVDSYLAAYFERAGGEKLLGKTSTYRSKEGQLAVYKSLKPGYDPTVYEDAQLFLPYEEIQLGRGVFNLKADIDLIYKDGTLFQHLTWGDFVFRRQ